MNRRRSLTLGLGLAAAIATRSRAAPAPPDPVTEEARRLMAQWAIPALSYAVIADGRIVSAQAFGLRRATPRTPVTPATLFQAASLSKTIAAATALKLAEQGKLALDTDINDVLTLWKLPASPLVTQKRVTLRRLLGMTGGINVPGYLGYAPGAPLPTLPQILDGLPPANSAAVRVIVPPATTQLYSGGGYQIVEAAIESVTGRSFAQVARELVLVPNDMKLSGYDSPWRNEKTANVVAGHDRAGQPMPGGGNVLPELAAAGLWSTPSDLARLLLGMVESYSGVLGARFDRDSIQQMLNRVDGFGYGLGGALSGSGHDLVFMKRGHNVGYHSYMLVFPATGHGAAVMTNSESGEHALEPLIRRIAEAHAWPAFGGLAE